MLSNRVLRASTPIMAAVCLLVVTLPSGCSQTPHTNNAPAHLCASDPPARTIRRPAYRFVNEALRQDATWDDGNGPYAPVVASPPSPLATTTLPTATINDDTRFVLMSPKRALVFYEGNYKVGASLEHTFPLVIKKPLPYSRHLLILPAVEILLHRNQLPRKLVTVPAKAATLDFVVKLPPQAKGHNVDVWIEALWADWSATTTYMTPEVIISADSVLEFATGVLHEQWKTAAVELQLQACRRADCQTLFAETLDADEIKNNLWISHKIPLDGIQGDHWRFVFRSQQTSDDSGARVFPVWANPTVYAPEPIGAGSPNVILLSVDTLRADVLQDYGETDRTAPFIHKTFGKAGTVFEQCAAAATSTAPSHMSMFTGLQPSVHGLTSGREVVDGHLNTVPEILRNASIETGAVTEDAWLSARSGFARGFNVYVENKSADIRSLEGQIEATFDRAVTWLRRNRDKRFFFFIHTYQVHNPYTPPEAYKKMFRTEYDSEQNSSEQAAAADDKMLYKQEIRYTDDEIAELLNVLAKLGLKRNTVFILISDHGEAFYEHGYYLHGDHLYQEVLHVPMMLTGPCIARQHRVKQQVGHIDLAPTLLDLFSVNPPYPLPGKSLLALAQGKAHDPALDHRRYFGESWNHYAVIARKEFVSFEPPAYSVRVGNNKLVRYRVEGRYRFEYFDLADDPMELHDLWPRDRSMVKELVTALASYHWRAARDRRIFESTAGTSITPKTTSAVDRAVLDPAQENKLRALGYLQ